MGKLTSPQAGAAEALYSVRLRDKVKVDDDPVTMLPEYSTAEALTPLSKLRPDAAHDVLHHSSNSSATPSSKGVAASKKVLDDAFVFVDRAKEKCKPDVYERFLEILKGFKQGKYRPFDVSRRITLLFHVNGQKELIQEMYKFTPWEYQFHLPSHEATGS